MDGRRDRQPLSDRVRALGGTAELVREVQKTEQIAMAGVSHVAANGRFPHWPIDRYIVVLGFAGMVVLNIFNAGGNWNGVNQSIAELKGDVSSLKVSVASIDVKVNDLRVDVARGSNPSPAMAVTPASADRRDIPPGHGYRFGSGESLIARQP